MVLAAGLEDTVLQRIIGQFKFAAFTHQYDRGSRLLGRNLKNVLTAGFALEVCWTPPGDVVWTLSKEEG